MDVDVVVVGSGFGGSVTALRLAEKGYRVLVLEAGRRFEDEDFAQTSWDARRYLWAPQLGCYGIQRIHRLPDVVVLAGAGVGGGSLNYANTLYVPPTPFFRDEQWADITDWESELAPHYETASRMLGVVTNPCHGFVEELMQRTADDLGVGESFRKTPVGVFFGTPGRDRRRPLLRWRRPEAHRLHRVRQLHGRLPGGRQEHAAQELPRARREPRRRDRADAHGDPAGRRAGHGGRARRRTGCCTSAPGRWAGATCRSSRRATSCWPPAPGAPRRCCTTWWPRASCRGCRATSATAPAPTPRPCSAR